MIKPAEDHTPQTISKAEAAALLGCNPKTLERYANADKLQKFERPGKRGVEVYYLKSEVDALKQERESGPAAPAIIRQPTTDSDSRHPVTKNQAEFAMLLAEALISKMGGSGLLLPGATDIRRQTRADFPLSVAIESKPLLTLDEARALTGLSRNHLIEAIHAKKLKAKIIGRGWRIKRSDLDAYLKKL